MTHQDDFSFAEDSGWELDERFADWVDGRLSPEELARLEAELDEDPELLAAAESYRATVLMLQRELPGDVELEPPVDLMPNVMGQLAAEESGRWWVPLAGSAAAAAAMVAIFVFLQGMTDGGFERSDGVAKRTSSGVVFTPDARPAPELGIGGGGGGDGTPPKRRFRGGEGPTESESVYGDPAKSADKSKGTLSGRSESARQSRRRVTHSKAEEPRSSLDGDEKQNLLSRKKATESLSGALKGADEKHVTAKSRGIRSPDAPDASKPTEQAKVLRMTVGKKGMDRSLHVLEEAAKRVKAPSKTYKQVLRQDQDKSVDRSGARMRKSFPKKSGEGKVASNKSVRSRVPNEEVEGGRGAVQKPITKRKDVPGTSEAQSVQLGKKNPERSRAAIEKRQVDESRRGKTGSDEFFMGSTRKQVAKSQQSTPEPTSKEDEKAPSGAVTRGEDRLGRLARVYFQEVETLESRAQRIVRPRDDSKGRRGAPGNVGGGAKSRKAKKAKSKPGADAKNRGRGVGTGSARGLLDDVEKKASEDASPVEKREGVRANGANRRRAFSIEESSPVLVLHVPAARLRALGRLNANASGERGDRRGAFGFFAGPRGGGAGARPVDVTEPLSRLARGKKLAGRGPVGPRRPSPAGPSSPGPAGPVTGGPGAPGAPGSKAPVGATPPRPEAKDSAIALYEWRPGDQAFVVSGTETELATFFAELRDSLQSPTATRRGRGGRGGAGARTRASGKYANPAAAPIDMDVRRIVDLPKKLGAEADQGRTAGLGVGSAKNLSFVLVLRAGSSK